MHFRLLFSVIRLRSFAILVILLAAAGCEEVEQFVDSRRPDTPHEAYLQGLHDAGLAGTALSQAWIHQAAEAVRNPRQVELPFQEEGFIAPEAPDAVGYRFSLRRGQTLTIRLYVQGDGQGRVFLDLLRVPEDGRDPPRPVEADTLPDGLLYEPFRDGEFLVRVQPELLTGGQYSLILTLDPALDFPVAGHSVQAIQSLWGAPRDGGRRSHEGVDIFARRGTPVLASVEGVVRRANVTTLGGKVVWLRDEKRNRSLYYAHLDSQAVVRGQRVQVGDTLGFVGNTGNAITTPPHLHFGIYYRGEGAVNPAPYLRPPPGRLVEVNVDREFFGQWVRVRTDGIYLRDGPSRRAPVSTELTQHTPARVLGASSDWYRVALPDGRQGYVAARLTETLSELEPLVAEVDLPVQAAPDPRAARAEILPAGEAAAVVGRFAGFLHVRAPSGRLAWVPEPAVVLTDAEQD
ncbi:MAG: peptidoglycan DD-metalloendopeptidase family protein [Gemmatimonadales bacterium]|jgi:murein DD-endopeptidase MepM/ murein hydrolase activator NlpD|nr:MAG: peptidoglycan DD-metalloendopeptidase family protein [Gemmatimonadales bacterium]